MPDGRGADELGLLTLLSDVLGYARERDYTGWDYADGMSSRIRRALPFDSKLVNLCFQESAKRAPVNLRPLLLVERRRNAMGAALFALANRNCVRLAATEAGAAALGDDVDYAAEARRLVEWLLETAPSGYSGFCVGHRHELQKLDARKPPDEPDVVSTAFAVRALLALADDVPGAERAARSAADFLFDDLGYWEVDGGAKIRYNLRTPDDYYTLNAGAVGARMMLDLYDHFGTATYRTRATKLLDYVATVQTDLGGWHYREPPEASHLSMDNHHNGFIVRCYQRHGEVVGTERFAHTRSSALQCYRNVLHEPTGAPNFDETSPYPRDVHASAVGMLVFTGAGDLAFAERILDWTLSHLYAGNGRFLFRKHRLYTTRVTLMRWCQAWMAYALSEFLVERVSSRRARPAVTETVR